MPSRLVSDAIERLKAIVGPKGVVTDPLALDAHLTEWRGTWRGETPLVVKPASTAEVAAVVTTCAEAGLAVVPQGGNTGLCGAGIPSPDGQEILLSMSRMNRVLSIEPDDYSITVEAGALLADIQAAARAADRFFPLSLAAEGSCQIGGNLSTNAGGTSVVRYGTARDQALGLEVVLADGRVWNGLRRLRKDTAGYDLKQLFIGAEGTLGIITAATLKLYPVPRNRQVAVLALSRAEDAVALFARLRGALADRLLAFELMSGRSLDFVCRRIPGSSLPFAKGAAWYVLVDATQPDGTAPFEDALAVTVDTFDVLDAVVAKNEDEASALWRLRHSISEAQKLEGASLKHDVSVPVGDVARFVTAAEAAALGVVPGARVVAFGHVGDGNIHFNLSQPPDMPPEDFLAERGAVARAVYDVVLRFGGSISAEHGVGVLKKDLLRCYRGDVDVDLMQAVKRALDPGNRLNPGKVVDIE